MQDRGYSFVIRLIEREITSSARQRVFLCDLTHRKGDN